jgi:hypothetical protein
MAGRAMPKLKLLTLAATVDGWVWFQSILCWKKGALGTGFSPTSHHFTDTTYSSVIRGMHQTRPASTIVVFDDDTGIEYLYFAAATQACTE